MSPKRRGWDEEELDRQAKGDAQKFALAVRLRAETAVCVNWIANRLRMGTAGYLNLLLCRQRAKAEQVANIKNRLRFGKVGRHLRNYHRGIKDDGRARRSCS